MLIPDEKAPLVREAFEVFATGAFPIEDVRKASWKNGLRNCSAANLVRCLEIRSMQGKIYVPETANEEGCLVKGVHEAIVPEDCS